jgi:hypothetical protein
MVSLSLSISDHVGYRLTDALLQCVEDPRVEIAHMLNPQAYHGALVRPSLPPNLSPSML